MPIYLSSFVVINSAASAAIFIITYNSLNLPEPWFYQCILLYSMHGLCTILIRLFKMRKVQYVLFSVSIVFFTLIVKPVPPNQLFVLFLFLSMLGEIMFLFMFPMDLAMHGLLFSILFIILPQDRSMHWNRERAVVGLYDTIWPIYTSIVVILLLVAINYLVHEIERRISEYDRQLDINRKLSLANYDFQKYAVEVNAAASQRERDRITREIHDTVGYALTNIIMSMEAFGDLIRLQNLKGMQDLLDRVKDLGKESLNEVRRTLRVLRAEQRPEPNLSGSLFELTRNFQNVTRVSVLVDYGNIPQTFGLTVDGIIFHIVQEAMTNALRHGNADTIHILFWETDGIVQVAIRDNGYGCDMVQEGIGLAGMRERLSELGGRYFVGNTEDGFLLRASIPYASALKGEGQGL